MIPPGSWLLSGRIHFIGSGRKFQTTSPGVMSSRTCASRTSLIATVATMTVSFAG